MIAEPPRERYALIPAVLIGVALAPGAAARDAPREAGGWRSALAVGLGVVLLAAAAALAGKDYVVERNLLPALRAARRRRRRSASPRAGRAASACSSPSCSAPTGSPSTSTSPRRRTCSAPTSAPSPKSSARRRGPRAIVTWKLAADPVEFYLDDGAQRALQRRQPVRRSRRGQQAAGRRAPACACRAPSTPWSGSGSSALPLSATCRGAPTQSGSTRCATCRPASAATRS